MITYATSPSAASLALAGAPSPVVVVPVHNGLEDVVRCYESLLRHTPTTHSILVVDDAGADRAPIAVLDGLGGSIEHNVVVLVREENGGFVGACNDAFAATRGRDVLVVNSDCVVGPEFLQRLSAAAASSTLVATVSTLTNHGTILSVPSRNTPVSVLPGGMSADEAARRVAGAAVGLRPTIPTAVGHCVYFRRSALDLLGGFDPIFGTGYGEEVDFSQRAIRAGMRTTCADDVFVYHRGGGSFGADAAEQQQANEAIVNARYPWYRAAVERVSADEGSSLAVALDRARVALTSRRIGIDALMLGTLASGTELVIMQTIAALARLLEHGDSFDELVVLHGVGLDPGLADVLRALPHCRLHGIEYLSPPDHPIVDVVYRPCQVRGMQELEWLRGVGRRVVVSQLDTIAWSNPSYFGSVQEWEDHRALTALTLAAVDGVAFISEAARTEADAEGLLAGHAVTRVVGCGTDDPSGLLATAEPRRPVGMPDVELPFLLALGVSYHHKNRAFSLRLLRSLRERGWDGMVVFAGATPPWGSSLGAEAFETLGDPDLRRRVVDLGVVTEAGKRWLFDRAALTLYPSSVEGFGLVPFESAERGVPVLASTGGSLHELFVGIDALDGFDLDAATDLAMRLLSDADAAAEQCDALVKCASVHTWERTGREVLSLMDEVLARRPNPVLAVATEASVVGLVQPEVRVPRPVSEAFERLVRATQGVPALKQVASPDGSARQQYLRRSINRVRRFLG